MKVSNRANVKKRLLGLLVGVTVAIGAAAVARAVGVVFAVTGEPAGIAASRSLLLVTTVDNTEIQQISAAGVASHFATLPAPAAVQSHLAIAPRLAQQNFGPGTVYATQGPRIYRIGAGGVASLFATIPIRAPSTTPLVTVAGITFDHVGTFGNRMLISGATDTEGQVWEITDAGVVTFVANIANAVFLQGPAVAPTGFGRFGGRVFVTDQTTDTIYAVARGNLVDVASSWPAASAASVIPTTTCGFRGGNNAFFLGIELPESGIDAYPAGDFAGLGGQMLIASESGAGLGRLFANAGSPTGYTTVAFPPDVRLGVAEQGTFVDCDVRNQCVLGSDSLTLNDRTIVQTGAGAGNLEVGADAAIRNDADVRGNAFLRSRAAINGTLTLQGTLTVQDNTSIGVLVQAPVTLDTIPQRGITVGTVNREVPNNATQTVAPGNYASIMIRARATATLNAGTYNTRTFTIEPTARVIFNTAGGAITINAQNNITVFSNAILTATNPRSISFYSNGTVSIQNDLTLPGSVDAPLGEIAVESRNVIQGCLRGRRVRIGPDTRVVPQ
jgi:hypothetical protein